MARYAQWIDHHEQPILFLDCANAEEAEVLTGLDEVESELLTIREGQKALLLLDMSNVQPSMALTTRGDELINACGQAGIPEVPTAMVGPAGWQKTMMKMYSSFRKSKNLHVADNLEEAKEWLVTYKT
jgi:hypothetical protein